ncbi:MAG TPA: Wzz/FepE/Etk N-terminal domain-containing protein, partial [Pseudacidobacterium sp.]|nr:Wzz/FepE/Etk N-terminal domain-containing protein [Pseudacidobacterium sp.]
MDTGRLLERPPDRTRDDSFQLANLQEMYGPSVREQSLGDYGRILLKHKWTVIVTAVVVLIVAALISIRMTPIYEA